MLSEQPRLIKEEFEEPTIDWEQWVIDHFVVEVNMDALTEERRKS
jgi:hypothetical protein